MADRKCRKSIQFSTSKIKLGAIVRSKALIRCDLKAGHEGQHWLALLTPFKKGQKARQVGYMFWSAEGA